MENASKALLMAGSIFLSLLVIALLITMYQNLIQVEQVEYQGELTEQIAEYNKQYEVYQRDNLYGSDILSLANKIMDYNAREIDEKGYQEMKISVKFKDRIDDTYFRDTQYDERDLSKQYTKLDDEIKKYSNYTKFKNDERYFYKGKSMAYYSGLRIKELNNEVGEGNATVRNGINQYITLKNIQTDIKRKTFKCIFDKTKYDKNNGRIVEMHFEEK